MFQFHLEKVCPHTGARAGTFHTPHGVVHTPVFMPVGTLATVKAMAPFELEWMGAEIVLGNTYHLALRPGSDLVAQAGGLHAFMGWHKPILTDSGGFQVFSLGELRRITEEGVNFRSHIDGSSWFLSPEKAVAIQEELGADIIMAFDECVSWPTTEEYSQKAMERTLRWAERCQKAHTRHDQALFGIVQGAFFPEQRIACAKALGDMDFPGYAIGGLSVGEPHETMYRMLEHTLPHMPLQKPRYLMGVGWPSNLVEGVARGVDMFDCVLPTRNGRNGTLLTSRGRVNIKRAEFARDFTPLEEKCSCYTCTHFTKAYLHHLYRVREILASRLCSWHNLHFLIHLMKGARLAILEDRFPDFRKKFWEYFEEPQGQPEP